ncbi:MAG: hypothetical protein K5669_05185 [Lachnospiraceae bacterium]|nr:hypothetical protein [Lachnospiraceae bacterium]
MNIKNTVYAALSIILALGLILGFTLVARGGSNTEEIERSKYLSARTEEYKTLIRDYLKDGAYTNAGVTVTYITENENSRVYRVKLHHKRFDDLSSDKKQKVCDDIMNLAFCDENCEFEVVLD